MRGSITKRDGGYQVVVDLGPDPLSGKRRRRAKTFTTLADAERALPEMLRAARARTPAPKSLTVGEMLDRWLTHVEPDLSPNTVVGYRKKVDGYLRPALGDLALGKLTRPRIAALYRAMRDKGLSAATVRRAHSCLSSACTLALEWGWLAENPCPKAPPAPRADIEAPEVVDVARALAECGQDMTEAALLAIATGARRGELCGLQWRDVERGTVTFRRAIADDCTVIDVHRKSRIRSVAIDAAMGEVLEQRHARLARAAFLFGTPVTDVSYVLAEEPGQRAPLKPERLTGRWRDACKRAGVHVRFHDLRHLSVTTLLAAGLPVPNVAKRHGHGAAVMLSTYAHAIQSVDDRAAEIMGDLTAKLTVNAPRKSGRQHSE